MTMFTNELQVVPHKPGSYQMIDNTGRIIYIGKAKDLKHRLSSYFNGKVTGKTARMVSEVHHFEYIVTSSEIEALILEINLIKKHDPKYNILLKDDKSYPYIELIRKPYPKLRIVRYLKIKKSNNAKLFGPYPNSNAAKRTVNLINRLFPLKKCDGHPKKTCLYYHIGECFGYCEHSVSESDLNKMEQNITNFLNGDIKELKKMMKDKITFYADNLNFERAQEIKEELAYVEVIANKQKMEWVDLINRDIVNFYEKNTYACIQIFFIRRGKLLGSHHEIFQVAGDLKEEIEQYLVSFYQKKEVPREIIVPFTINAPVLSEVITTNVIHVQKGKKKKLLDLVYNNARMNLENEFELIKKDERRTFYANEDLKNILGLDKLEIIEIFDNSNLFGTFSVSGLVVFKNGVPSRKDYRKYKISLEKNDDYHMMREVIYRRYYRLLMESSPLPDLIIVDGGVGQMTGAKEVLADLHLNIPLCGLKKDEHHHTSMLINNNLENINIDKHSALFDYLSRIQDEVHRYTINYHKQIRSKGTIASVLDEVPGIGKVYKKELIKKYGSLKNMAMIGLNELEKQVPKNTARLLFEFLKNYR